MRIAGNKLFVVATALLFTSLVTIAQNKFALVIGVKDYVHVAPLKNSLNDAADISKTLKSKGFQVIEVYNPKTKRDLIESIKQYHSLLSKNENAVGLVFYSGHGMQVDGINYFLPTQSNPQIKADLDEQAVKMEYMLAAVEEAGNALNIFILDACRNNPFRSFSRSTETGLNQISAPKGSFVVYATAPGSVASDGVGRNGLFTSKLLKYINTPDIAIDQVFKYVARDVQQESNGSQLPWINYSYYGEFSFDQKIESKQVSANAEATKLNIQPETEAISKVSVPSLDYGYGTSDSRTIIIGKQEWFGKNLNTDRFVNGDPIPEAKTEEEWKKAFENKQPAWCYQENKSTNSKEYGRLYNWHAVNDPRGLAPEGWHIPTDEEWNILTNYLGGETKAGSSMKGDFGWEKNGNNSSGFVGLPAGSRGFNGVFSTLGKFGIWWSSSEGRPGKAWSRVLLNDPADFQRGDYEKGGGFSVRCLRDIENQTASIPVSTPLLTYSSVDFGYGSGKTASVMIGDQVWITQNLNVDHFANGDLIPEAKTYAEWLKASEKKRPAWCYYNNDSANAQTYGKLYNWYAVADSRGLAPNGWHIPSDQEWTVMTNHVGGQPKAGLQLKNSSGWVNSGSGDNESGFAGLPGGYRSETHFHDLGTAGHWWSSTGANKSEGQANRRGLSYDSEFVYDYAKSKGEGLSVRCIKD